MKSPFLSTEMLLMLQSIDKTAYNSAYFIKQLIRKPSL